MKKCKHQIEVTCIKNYPCLILECKKCGMNLIFLDESVVFKYLLIFEPDMFVEDGCLDNVLRKDSNQMNLFG